MCNFRCKTLLYQNLNQNYNILYLEHLIYDLSVRICVFFLHQESFDMILVNNPSFYDEGLTGARSMSRPAASSAKGEAKGRSCAKFQGQAWY
jgi:hypothetical protein